MNFQKTESRVHNNEYSKYYVTIDYPLRDFWQQWIITGVLIMFETI